MTSQAPPPLSRPQAGLGWARVGPQLSPLAAHWPRKAAGYSRRPCHVHGARCTVHAVLGDLRNTYTVYLNTDKSKHSFNSC